VEKDIDAFYRFLSYGKSPQTARTYSGNVRRFLLFTRKESQNIEPNDVTNWYSHMKATGYSNRTINHCGWSLKSYFEFKGYRTLKNQVPIMEYFPTEPKWMPESVLYAFIEDNPLFSIGYDLALRVGEVPLLKKSWFNSDTGEIRVTRLKHKSHNNLYFLKLSPWCLPLVNNWIEDHPTGDQIFSMSTRTIGNRFKKRTRELNLDGYTWHSLRHSRITHRAIQELKENGFVDELSLAKFAGHLRVETTRLYVHLASGFITFQK